MAFDYHEYLASRKWAAKKDIVKFRSGGRCERCKNGSQRAVHHLTYEHVGDEYINELLAVCQGCHDYLSARTDYDPAAGLEEANWSLQRWLAHLHLMLLFHGWKAAQAEGVEDEAVYKQWTHFADCVNRRSQHRTDAVSSRMATNREGRMPE